MWIGRSRVAFVCLRYRRSTNCPLSPYAQSWIYPPQPEARAQSTATAVIEEQDKDGEEKVSNERPPSRRPKKRLRRLWKPSPVAELGVSSLGKPAEVLVLKDRDRHLPAATDDYADRSNTSESRILEALQAENVPLSSENVKQSLDQIGAPYRNKAKASTARSRITLLKKVLDGFTLQQLQSYCSRDDQHGIANPSVEQADKSKVKRQAASRPDPGERSRIEKRATTLAIQREKTDLVKYIIHHKWALPSPDREHSMIRIPLKQPKLDYFLNCIPSTLPYLADMFKVVLTISQRDALVEIKGELAHVNAASEAFFKFVRRISVSEVRSVMKGPSLRKIASPEFLDHISRTHKVILSWASREEQGLHETHDALTICSHKKEDRYNAQSAERAILLAERPILLSRRVFNPQQRVSMLTSTSRTKLSLVSHQTSKESNNLTHQNAWARWVLPREPLHLLQADPVDREAHAQGPNIEAFFGSLNPQKDLPHKLMEGTNDNFFYTTGSKQLSKIRKLIDTGKISEEISVHFGQILFSNLDLDIKSDFSDPIVTNKVKLFRLLHPTVSTRFLSDLPGLPNILRSMSPLEDVENNRDSSKYRLRYVPQCFNLPRGFEAPVVEVSISRHAKPGYIVQNHLETVWAMLDKQSHTILTPALGLDLEFVRHLKSLLFDSRGPRDESINRAMWWNKIIKQFYKLEEDQFPPLLTLIMPRHTFKDDRGETQRVEAEQGEPYLD